MNRRQWMAGTGAAAAGLWVSRFGWAAAVDAVRPPGRRLVVILLRGAVDGLSVVVPYGDAAYYRARSSIAIGKPGTDDGALDLDGRFGLHPALAPLLPHWKAGALAFVHAAGSPDPSRSHFDAQDFMETGTPGVRSTADGWMNRLLGQLPGARAPTSAVNLGATQARILAGSQPVASIALGKRATRPIATDRPAVAAAFDALYAADDALGNAYREGRRARTDLLVDLDDGDDAGMAAGEDPRASRGAPPAQEFPLAAAQLAQILRRDARTRLAFLALGGWDTHINQGGAKGQLANRLQPLGAGLDTLARELGPLLADTTIVVMSEFGRTVAQNGNGGTDHGHGNAIWLLGGGVAGGKIYGEWPGLEMQARYEGRDLAVTTDFRAVLASLCAHRLGLDEGRLAAVFPHAPSASAPKGLFKA